MTSKFLFDFSEQIWFETYKYHTDNNIQDTWRRVAKDLASAESDPQKWEDLFYEVLDDFKAVPGGRITSNAGTGLHGTTYINCFVSGATGKDQDSIEGIFDSLTRAALTLKSEGGYGFCCDFIRPRGAFIHGVGVESPGAVEMLNLWDTMSSVITKGSGKLKKKKEGKNKIRKGAMMVTMSCWHPDIEQFITAKQNPGVLSKFNMSTLCTNAFMEAVKTNQPWNLEFPDTTHPDYKDEWDGFLDKWKAKGYPTIVYKTYSDANELWNIIMTSTYNRNEPGILFVDRMNELNNLWYCESINATNPCGEQVLPIGGVCLLGSLNLTQFINKDRTDFDYKKLKKYIPVFVRLLDNVNDKTRVPLEEQRWNLVNKRRIGIGYLGYGSALFLMKQRYGSPEALKLTDYLCKFITNETYKASALLAKEKGAFPLFKAEHYLESEFVKQALDEDTIDLIKEHGLRNSHLTSIQPTGNSSVYANNVSGGLEPVFMFDYYRTKTVPIAPDELNLPLVDWTNKTFESPTAWEWTKEGDEDLLLTTFNTEVYKFDRNRGLTKENLVEDYGVHVLRQAGEWDAEANWAANISHLSIDDHVKTMKVFARYIDSAMSKTVNIEHDYPYEDFKKLYLDFYDSGVIKGGTTYRAGTMTVVLSKESTKKEAKIPKTTAPKRPKDLVCDVHQLTVDGERWIVFVGLYDDQPYEVFAGRVNQVDLSKKIKNGTLVKVSAGKYAFHYEDIVEIKDITQVFNNSSESALTRMISTSLRHGAEIKFVVNQLLKTEGGINTFSKSIARVLKKYIHEGEALPDVTCPSCGSKNVIMAEGCNKCLSCGYSGCS